MYPANARMPREHGWSLDKAVANEITAPAKGSHFGPERGALQVRQYFATVSHVVELAQRSVENTRQIEFFAPGVDRSKIWSRLRSTANRCSASGAGGLSAPAAYRIDGVRSRRGRAAPLSPAEARGERFQAGKDI